MTNDNLENNRHGAFWLNLAIFLFLLRPPGFSFVLIIIASLSFVSMMMNDFSVVYNKKFLALYLFVFYMISRCFLGFYFEGGVEERYVLTLILFSIILFIHAALYYNASLSSCYSGIKYAVIVTVFIAVFEIVTGYHTPASRYSDLMNPASGWSVSKPTAFYYNENDMLSFLVCFLPLALFALRKNSSRLVIFLLTLLCAVYVGSKAAILTILFYFIFTRIVSKKEIIVYSIFVALLALIFYPNAMDKILELSTSSSERFLGFWDALTSHGGDESTSERMMIYSANIDWLANAPFKFLFGSGLFDSYQIDIVNGYGLRMGEFHNIHLEIITIFGFVFYITLFSFYIYNWIMLYHKRRDNEYISPILLSAFLYPIIISFGPSSSLKYPFLLILIFMMIIGNNESEKYSEENI